MTPMSDREPEARLPDEITLTRSEVARLLFALDIAVENVDPGSPTHRQLRAAQKLITAKLWPELADLLDEPPMRDRTSLMVMSTNDRLTVPEVARRLGIPGEEVYEKIFAGELDGRPEPDGAVYVSAETLDVYLRNAPNAAPRR
jgi:hypothetical protein